MQVISREKIQNWLLILMCSWKRWIKWHTGWEKRVVPGSTALFYNSWGSWAVPALLRHYYKCHITLYTCSIPKRSLHTNDVIFQKLKASTVEAWPLKMCVCSICKREFFFTTLWEFCPHVKLFLLLSKVDKINLGTPGDGLWHHVWLFQLRLIPWCL